MSCAEMMLQPNKETLVHNIIGKELELQVQANRDRKGITRCTEHSKAGSLKTTPLPFPELCAELFDGNTVTGNCKWTSTQTTSVIGSSSCYRVKPLMITGTIFHDTEDDAGTNHQTSEPTPNKTTKSSIIADDLALNMQKVLQYLIKGKGQQFLNVL
ncbi:hypothetical protein M8C21_001576 [Ambrosia artemisiifolia]|uniref:Uncharacterized protein n=1 Tax=Ambrosia artemisiifolia TaxID=4212 RepID=A0AAD5GU55_AMBAR|nr:hypothetical protein M8C21_001576 [Ambrosia artemisiifolia]